MLFKAVKQASTSSQRFFGATVSRFPVEKNYYKMLEINKDATPEQIKEQYHKLVKQYHPDLATTGTPNAEKFREIMEAYAVLSVRESRVSYDLQMRKNPDAFREVSEPEHN